MLFTAYEVSKKYGISASHLRLLMRKGVLSGRSAKLTKSLTVWLIDEKSVRRYKAARPSPGRKPATKKRKR